MSSFMNDPNHSWNPKGPSDSSEGWVVLGLYIVMAIVITTVIMVIK